MTLPPEILDEILEHIPVGDVDGERRTLIACALVATWWTAPSQRRLSSSVAIHDHNYQKGMDGLVLSGLKPHLLGFVHSLTHRRGPLRTGYEIQDLPKDSGNYHLALRNLRSLTLCNTRFKRIDEGLRTCFSAFRETLTYLSFDTVVVSFSAFVTLADYFPNIRTLLLHSIVHEDHGEPIPPLSRPLRGKVHVHHSRIPCLGIFKSFPGWTWSTRS